MRVVREAVIGQQINAGVVKWRLCQAQSVISLRKGDSDRLLAIDGATMRRRRGARATRVESPTTRAIGNRKETDDAALRNDVATRERVAQCHVVRLLVAFVAVMVEVVAVVTYVSEQPLFSSHAPLYQKFFAEYLCH